MNKSIKIISKLLGLLFALIYFITLNWIEEVQGYSCSIGFMTAFIYFAFSNLGEYK